jgi:hypothetical protein
MKRFRKILIITGIIACFIACFGDFAVTFICEVVIRVTASFMIP